jgi:hypothetical protein
MKGVKVFLRKKGGDAMQKPSRKWKAGLNEFAPGLRVVEISKRFSKLPVCLPGIWGPCGQCGSESRNVVVDD